MTLESWQWILNYDTKTTCNKKRKKNSKLDCIKYKNFYASKSKIKKVKTTYRIEQITANYLSIMV